MNAYVFLFNQSANSIQSGIFDSLTFPVFCNYIELWWTSILQNDKVNSPVLKLFVIWFNRILKPSHKLPSSSPVNSQVGKTENKAESETRSTTWEWITTFPCSPVFLQQLTSRSGLGSGKCWRTEMKRVVRTRQLHRTGAMAVQHNVLLKLYSNFSTVNFHARVKFPVFTTQDKLCFSSGWMTYCNSLLTQPMHVN